MSKKPIYSDLERLDAMKDEDIDYSDTPAFDDTFFERAELVFSPGKKQIALRVDTDVLEWMQGQGKGYQTRMNAILRAYYEAHRDRGNLPQR